MPHRTLNLGILAHVDAGKTTLTERLLFAAGVIDEVGSVDDGTTQTDSLALERQRGITIKSAVVSFAIGGTGVNLIDTPGHPDFIAEVERALGVLDGAVLVVSAVEGVQPQTRILMRALQRLRVPALLFVNKIDRGGADYDRVLRDISARLTPAIVSMSAVAGAGTRAARAMPAERTDAGFTARLAEALAGQNDEILAAYLDGAREAGAHEAGAHEIGAHEAGAREIGAREIGAHEAGAHEAGAREAGAPALGLPRLRRELAAQTRRALVHPVFAGSALTGAGIGPLMDGIARLLPAAGRDAGGPVSGRVFKIERGPAGEKIAYVRMFSGTVRTRDKVRFGAGDERKVTAIERFDRGPATRRESVSAGQIGKLWGLTEIRVGDAVGAPGRDAGRYRFAPPTLETVVVPRAGHGSGALREALAQLAEQDPLISVRQDDISGEISVCLYGEVQKEVIGATLAAEFGIDAGFRETTTICIERLVGTGAAVERLHKPPNPFLATVGLRLEPAAPGSGIEFRIAVELGSMPLAFFRAVEDTVRETLRQGLHGWAVPDCLVTMTHSGYLGKHSLGHQRFNKSLSSTGEDYRKLTPLVLMTALRRAGTVVCEPVHRFRLEVPADVLGSLLPALARLRAVPLTQVVRAATATLEGDIPAARVHELRQQLPGLTRGEGLAECILDRYQPVTGAVPERPRWDNNPLDRVEYLQRVTRRAVIAGRAPAGR